MTVDKVISAAFSDIGFDVDVGPLFQTPEEQHVKLLRMMFILLVFRPWRLGI